MLRRTRCCRCGDRAALLIVVATIVYIHYAEFIGPLQRDSGRMSNEGTVALNNYLQTKDQTNLLSWDESTTGPRHAPTWICICKIDQEELGRGTGPSKHTARDAAAKAALERLVRADQELS